MTTTRTPATTPTAERAHCGHVGRSGSQVIVRASILAECLRTVPGFSLPVGEPVAVLAVVEAITAGAPCDTLHPLAEVVEWHAAAVTWADLTDAPYLILPEATGLAALLPLIYA